MIYTLIVLSFLMIDIMRAELMGRQNEMLGLTSRQNVSTWKI